MGAPETCVPCEHNERVRLARRSGDHWTCHPALVRPRVLAPTPCAHALRRGSIASLTAGGGHYSLTFPAECCAPRRQGAAGRGSPGRGKHRPPVKAGAAPQESQCKAVRVTRRPLGLRPRQFWRFAPCGAGLKGARALVAGAGDTHAGARRRAKDKRRALVRGRRRARAGPPRRPWSSRVVGEPREDRALRLARPRRG